jgi:hypothetical protein
MINMEAKSRNGRDQLVGAVAGRESNGGASHSASRQNGGEQTSLTENEERILQCLGAAVILQWNDLPTHIKRQLFDHAASTGEPRNTTQLKEQIARFLHKHKDDIRELA